MSTSSLQWIDVFPEPCLLVTPEGVMARANPAFLRLLKTDLETVTRQNIFTIISGDQDKARAYLEICSKNRNFIIGSLSFPATTGTQSFRCEGAALTVKDAQEATLILLRLKPKQAAVVQFTALNEKIHALTREIQHRAATEEALRRSETLFRELADAMPQIVWAARPDGTLDYYNRRWYELTGAEEDQIGDQSWLPILHPNDRQKTLDRWMESVRTGQKYEIEYRFKFPHENRYRWHLGRALPVRDAEGRIIRWFGTCTDIDDQKLAEEKLEQAVAERTASLLEAVSQLEEFSYSVSHDLRAPLRTMQGYAQILLMDYADQVDDDARDYLRRIARAGERMDKLIIDVLTYSQVARSEIQLQPISISKLVNEVVDQHPQLQSPHAEIEVTALPCVLGHEPSLTQVISNLLINAVKFVPQGVTPKVRVRSETEGSHVQIWFDDNGIGIAPEHQHKIFGLFERISPEKHYPGTGIGLAIVRKALERMGGQVGVCSDGVNGCQFWIKLRAVE